MFRHGASPGGIDPSADHRLCPSWVVMPSVLSGSANSYQLNPFDLVVLPNTLEYGAERYHRRVITPFPGRNHYAATLLPAGDQLSRRSLPLRSQGNSTQLVEGRADVLVSMGGKVLHADI